jgi:hypothetical protein
MSEVKSNQDIKLGYDNWNMWDRQIKSTIRRKNAYIAFDPQPTDPCNPKQVVPPTTATPSSTPRVTFTPQPSLEKVKTYREELKEWKTANNVAAGHTRHDLDKRIDSDVVGDKRLKMNKKEVTPL